MAKSRFFPNDYELGAEAVRAELSGKGDAIRDLTDQMAEDLADLRNGVTDSEVLESLLGRAEELMQRTEDLQPAVAMASDFSGELAEVRTASKAGEIARLGYSAKADFLLEDDQGAGLCAERFAFGVSEWRSTNTLLTRLSYRDEVNANSSLEPGEALSVASSTTKTTVTYIGPVGEGEDERLGFDVACDPI